MPELSGQTLVVRQLSDVQRKLGITPFPVGGATGEVLTKLSPANFDFGWVAILGGLLAAGRGIVFAGNTVHFAQAAAYTPGAIPFASGVATMGFDAANLFWDNANDYLGIGTNAPVDRLHVARAYADANPRNMANFIASSSVPGSTKRVLNAVITSTGAALWNSGLLSGGEILALHEGSGNVTGTNRHYGLELYHGKGVSGTGAMSGSVGLFVQSVNQNVTGAIGTTYDIFIQTPISTGAIVNNFAIWQVSPTAFSYFAGCLSIGVATFNFNNPLRVERGFASTADCYGTATFMSNTASGNSAASHWGGFFRFTTDGANNYTLADDTVFGVDARAIHGGTGSCHSLNGIRAYSEKSGTGAVTAMYGGRFNIYNSNAVGAVTTGYGVFVGTPLVTGAITTYYGLRIEAGAGGTVYGVSQVGTADLNYLAGFSAFGSSSPVNTTFALFGASTAAISSQRILRGSAAYTGTVEGDLWNDFTQHCLTGFLAGVKQFDCRTLFVQTADATITNTNAETTMFGAGVGTLTCPANFFVVGKTLEIVLLGIHTMDATPPAITFRVKLGGVTFASTVYTDLNDANQYFEIRFHLTCRTSGAGGTGIGQGYVLMHESTGSSNTDMHELVMTATAAMNTTGALAIDVTAQPDVADAGSSITISNAYVRILA